MKLFPVSVRIRVVYDAVLSVINSILFVFEHLCMNNTLVVHIPRLPVFSIRLPADTSKSRCIGIEHLHIARVPTAGSVSNHMPAVVVFGPFLMIGVFPRDAFHHQGDEFMSVNTPGDPIRKCLVDSPIFTTRSIGSASSWHPAANRRNTTPDVSGFRIIPIHPMGFFVGWFKSFLRDYHKDYLTTLNTGGQVVPFR